MKRERAQAMADDLFELVEEAAGAAHISDGIREDPSLSRDWLIEVALFAARKHELCAKRLRKWAARHGSAPQAPRRELV